MKERCSLMWKRKSDEIAEEKREKALVWAREKGVFPDLWQGMREAERKAALDEATERLKDGASEDDLLRMAEIIAREGFINESIELGSRLIPGARRLGGEKAWLLTGAALRGRFDFCEKHRRENEMLGVPKIDAIEQKERAEHRALRTKKALAQLEDQINEELRKSKTRKVFEEALRWLDACGAEEGDEARSVAREMMIAGSGLSEDSHIHLCLSVETLKWTARTLIEIIASEEWKGTAEEAAIMAWKLKEGGTLWNEPLDLERNRKALQESAKAKKGKSDDTSKSELAWMRAANLLLRMESQEKLLNAWDLSYRDSESLGLARKTLKETQKRAGIAVLRVIRYDRKAGWDMLYTLTKNFYLMPSLKIWKRMSQQSRETLISAMVYNLDCQKTWMNYSGGRAAGHLALLIFEKWEGKLENRSKTLERIGRSLLGQGYEKKEIEELNDLTPGSHGEVSRGALDAVLTNKDFVLAAIRLSDVSWKKILMIKETRFSRDEKRKGTFITWHSLLEYAAKNGGVFLQEMVKELLRKEGFYLDEVLNGCETNLISGTDEWFPKTNNVRTKKLSCQGLFDVAEIEGEANGNQGTGKLSMLSAMGTALWRGKEKEARLLDVFYGGSLSKTKETGRMMKEMLYFAEIPENDVLSGDVMKNTDENIAKMLRTLSRIGATPPKNDVKEALKVAHARGYKKSLSVLKVILSKSYLED